MTPIGRFHAQGRAITFDSGRQPDASVVQFANGDLLRSSAAASESEATASVPGTGR